MTRGIVAVFALAILAIMAVAGFSAALENAGEDHTVVNESWTPSAGSITVLDESERNGAYYSRNVTVYDENDTVMDPGTDYEWIVENGTIKTVTGGGLDGDASALITYSFQQTTAEHRSIAAVLGRIPQALGLLFPAMLFVLLLLIMRGG